MSDAGTAFRRDERLVLFELAIARAMSTMYGPDGQPQRQRWRAPRDR